MKKILHIAEPFATGVLSFLLDITKCQVEDFEVYIAYGIRPLTPENVQGLFDKRINFIKVDSFNGAIGTVLNPHAYKEINKLFHEIKPDIVHLHSSASGFVGRWSIPCRKVKMFYTPHGYSFLMKDGSKLKNKFFLLMEYISAMKGATTVACSKGEYNEALKLPGKSTYVNNGINIEQLQEYVTEKDRIDSNPIVCTSGRICYQKNPKLFNEVAELLPNIKFVWIGQGEMDYELKAPNIEVTGWLSREDALKIMSNVNFFMLTSLWEGLPISLLEAMYLKNICLVSNVIGNNNVIQNGENGFICNNALEFVNIIDSFVNHRNNFEHIIDKAHREVIENYNRDLMAKRYNDIYLK